MPTYPLSIFEVEALYKQIQASVPIVSLNSDGHVKPDELQTQAQPIIDAFDDSPAAQSAQAFKATVKADQHAIETPTDPLGLMVRAIMAVLGKEMTLDPDFLITEVHAALEAAKPA